MAFTKRISNSKPIITASNRRNFPVGLRYKVQDEIYEVIEEFDSDNTSMRRIRGKDQDEITTLSSLLLDMEAPGFKFLN